MTQREQIYCKLHFSLISHITLIMTAIIDLAYFYWGILPPYLEIEGGGGGILFRFEFSSWSRYEPNV